MSSWIRYCLTLPLFILMRLSTFVLAPIAVKWFSTDDKLGLRPPFVWMMTGDNDLTGDRKWKREHVKDGDPLDYWNRVGWMWRNGGHNAAYGIFGRAGDAPLCQHRSFTPIGNRVLELYFGWSDAAYNGRCKMVLTIRFKRAK